MDKNFFLFSTIYTSTHPACLKLPRNRNKKALAIENENERMMMMIYDVLTPKRKRISKTVTQRNKKKIHNF